MNPIATKIAAKPQLASRIQTMLPVGMTLDQASKGFRNQGQFIAALHASRRLNIPFSQIKQEMVQEHESLGQAIHELRPRANAAHEAHDAEHEADHELHARVNAHRDRHRGEHEHDGDDDRRPAATVPPAATTPTAPTMSTTPTTPTTPTTSTTTSTIKK